jgi:hypothetical protein
MNQVLSIYNTTTMIVNFLFDKNVIFSWLEWPSSSLVPSMLRGRFFLVTPFFSSSKYVKGTFLFGYTFP